MKRAIAYGGGFGVLLIVYGVIYRLAGLEQIAGLTAPFYLALPICAYLVARTLPRSGNSLTFSSFATPAIGSSLLAAAMYCIYVFFYNTYVDDSLLQQLVQDSVAAWQAEGVPQATIDERATSLSFTPTGFALTVFILMSVVSLIGGLTIAWVMLRMSRR